MKKSKQIVVYPGFFNPLQKQHEKLIRWVIKQPQYAEIWIFLNPQTNYKDYLLDFKLRWQIIKQVFAKERKVVVKTSKIPYLTNQLFKKLHHENKQEYQFWFLLGSDNWNNLAEWEEGEELKTQTHFLIAKRKGFAVKSQSLPVGTKQRFLPLKAQNINSSAIRKGEGWTWLNMKTRQLIFQQGNQFLLWLLKENLSTEKFAHIKKVCQTMQKLNDYYHLKQKPEAIKMSAWFHDWAKDWTKKQTLAFYQQHQLSTAVLTKLPFSVWHSKSSAWYLKKELCYHNQAVFRAIMAHTTAGKRMSCLAKLLFVADKIEPTKTTNQAQWLRNQVSQRRFEQLFRMTLTNVVKNLELTGKKPTAETMAAVKQYLT